MNNSSFRKAMLRMQLTAACEIFPGSPEYRKYAKSFMPIDISLGHEPDTIDAMRWCPGKEDNGFFLILGASGSGKTEALKLIGNQLVEHAIPVLVLDFHGDVIFPGLSSVMMSSGFGSTVGVNPMELDSQQAHDVGLYDQRMALVEMISRVIPDISHNQKVTLTEAIACAYQHAGIFDDDPRTWWNPPPTFATVLELLEAWADDENMKSRRPTIRGCIAVVKSIFGHPIFRRDCSLSVDEILSAGARVDLSKVPDGIRYIAADTLLRKIFRALLLKGPIPVSPVDDLERFRLFIMIDEAKILSAATGHPNDSRLILNLLITEGRKFGIGLIMASQMSEHFGAEVKASVATRLVLKPMDSNQAKKNAPDMQVSPQDLLDLKGRGSGFFKPRSGQGTQRIQVDKFTDHSKPAPEPDEWEPYVGVGGI
ncbi:MAG: DUF853 family protein [bacterium]|nr:DUF853 family protein [bacterium]